MAYQDQTLTCRDCGNTFVWTASEQEFYAQKGFQNPPARCPSDRAMKKARMGQGGPRQSFEITCATCGKTDTVPFKPTGDRPVYCREHFQKTQ